MIAEKNCMLFGFLPDCVYDYASDSLQDMLSWQTSLRIGDVVAHIESLDAGYMSGLGESKDVFTGEYFPAAIYDDGPFVFPVDILRYLERGDIHGVPKEYEEYLINEHGLTPL